MRAAVISLAFGLFAGTVTASFQVGALSRPVGDAVIYGLIAAAFWSFMPWGQWTLGRHLQAGLQGLSTAQLDEAQRAAATGQAPADPKLLKLARELAAAKLRNSQQALRTRVVVALLAAVPALAGAGVRAARHEWPQAIALVVFTAAVAAAWLWFGRSEALDRPKHEAAVRALAEPTAPAERTAAP